MKESDEYIMESEMERFIKKLQSYSKEAHIQSNRHSWLEHVKSYHNKNNGETTEDADFEIIEPKQLE